MEEPQDKIIVLQAYDTVVEANLAKTKLDAYGIPCFLTDENFTGIYPMRNSVFPGVRLHIFENDEATARSILDEGKIFEGFIRCPQCNSRIYETHLTAWERISLVVIGIVGMIFPGSPHTRYRCHQCGHVFTMDEKTTESSGS